MNGTMSTQFRSRLFLFKVLKQALLSICCQYTFSAHAGGLLFNVTASGTQDTINITLCLNVNSPQPLSCQNYDVSGLTLDISTKLKRNYRFAGIKINTPGYRIIGKTPSPSPGFVFLALPETVTIRSPANLMTLTPTDSSLLANGISSTTIAVTVSSPNNNPVADDTVTFVTSGTCGTLLPSPATTGSNGLASVTYTSSTSIGSCVITATESNSGESSSITLQQTALVVSEGFNSNETTITSIPGELGSWSVYFYGSIYPLIGGYGGAYADQGVNPSFEYLFINDTPSNLGNYTVQGIAVIPNATQDIFTSGFNSLSFSLGVNSEWYQSGANFVSIITSYVNGVSTTSPVCNPSVAAVISAVSDTTSLYHVPLSAFTTVIEDCGNGSVTPAQILAGKVLAVDFQADGGTFAIIASGLRSTTNHSVAQENTSPATYPTSLSLIGEVSFLNQQPTPVISTAFNSDNTTATGTAGETGKWSSYFKPSVSGGRSGTYANQGANPSSVSVYINDESSKLPPYTYTYQGIGIDTNSAQNVRTSGYQKLSFQLGVNSEWYQTGANFVSTITANVPGVSTALCNPTVAAVVTALSDTPYPYQVPLSAYTFITQNCGSGSVTTANILAGRVLRIDFQADGGGAAITASGLTSNTNMTNAQANTSPATYPTTLNLVGGTSFVP